MPSPRDALLIQYRYDPLDRLMARTPANLPIHQRFYQKDHLATEIQGALAHSIFQQEDLLLAQQQRQGATTETTLLATDQQRSVLHILDKAQRQALAYSPYGHHTPTNGLLSVLGFKGERVDPVTGHYLLGNGYRAFNPVLMRFNSPDSWSPFGASGFNSYTYCKGDSVNRIDPGGHISFLGLIKLKIITRRWSKIASLRASLSLENTPTLAFQSIIKHLKGDDLVALSLTSKKIKTIVHTNIKPINLLKRSTESDYTNNLRKISLGQKKGYLPSQVIGNDDLHKTAIRVPGTDTEPGRSHLQNQYKNARINRQQKLIRQEEFRRKQLNTQRNREIYGEDYASDSSYDSD
ncbi:RHS repeat-associated core domain-containing protein [Pseudomonas sp. MWU13-2100]|uniref:RHS repeat-associated core domain-containing protein n=1 Tax=Pseudomonas sp. MWU13-2100 TaxID=2935075 RepID=UPI00200F0EC0|nr:RHS repeat-associated core domain-containing protein [Pseudomonas sp. MWU13-2100]